MVTHKFVGANSVRPREINDLPYILRLRRLCHGHLYGIEHILNENSVTRGGIVDEDVRHRSDELSVLDDGAARHSLHDAARYGEQVRVGDGDRKAF